MISILEMPASYDFVGNGVKYKITTDNYILTAGKTAIAEFSYVEDFIEPQRWGFFNPDSGQIEYAYAPSSLSGTTEQKVASVKRRLKEYLFFHKHYKVTQSGTKLIIETRQPYYFYWPDYSSTPAAFSRNTIQAGTNAEYRTGFKIGVVVSMDVPEDRLIKTIELEPDIDGVLEYSLGRLLKPNIQTFKPGLPSYAPARLEWPQFRYYIYEYYVQNGDTTILDHTIHTDRLLKGKIDYETYPGFSLAQSSSDNNIWMNSESFNEVWIGQEQFLYFFSYLDRKLLKIVTKAYCEDLVDREWTDFYIDNRNSEKKYVHFVSATGILNDANQYFGNYGIYKIDIWMEDESTHEVLSPVKTFKVIEKPMHVRQFAFLNKYGLLETFCAIGKSDFKYVNKKDISKRELRAGYSVGDKAYIEKKQKAHNEIEMTTGSLTKEQALEFQQVLNSEEFYEIIDNQYLPSIIEDGTFKIIPDSDDLVSIKFTYRRAFDK